VKRLGENRFSRQSSEQTRLRSLEKSLRNSLRVKIKITKILKIVSEKMSRDCVRKLQISKNSRAQKDRTSKESR
jgi:hypothetical protein